MLGFNELSLELFIHFFFLLLVSKLASIAQKRKLISDESLHLFLNFCYVSRTRRTWSTEGRVTIACELKLNSEFRICLWCSWFILIFHMLKIALGIKWHILHQIPVWHLSFCWIDIWDTNSMYCKPKRKSMRTTNDQWAIDSLNWTLLFLCQLINDWLFDNDRSGIDYYWLYW